MTVDVEIEEERVSIVDEDRGLDLEIRGRVPREWILIALAVIAALLGYDQLIP